MEVVIYGHGDHGSDVAAIARSLGNTVHFYDDDPRRTPLMVSSESWSGFYFGINDPHTKAHLTFGFRAGSPLVHPSVPDDFYVAYPGCVIGAGTVIGHGTYLGPHVHVGAGCTIIRTKVGKFSTVAPGVNMGGGCTIGARVFVGIGASIADRITIGDDAIVGAGAVVINDVPAGATVVGVPAKRLPQLTEVFIP